MSCWREAVKVEALHRRVEALEAALDRATLARKTCSACCVGGEARPEHIDGEGDGSDQRIQCVPKVIPAVRRDCPRLVGWEVYPGLVRLSIGRSPTGRELYALDIGPEPERRRPSVMVTANMHAAELAGSSVALSIAEAVLKMHADESLVPDDVPDTLAAVLREVRVVVVFRIAVDGADVVDDGRPSLCSSRRQEGAAGTIGDPKTSTGTGER